MRTIAKEELETILAKHRKWLRDEEGGERADLSAADLRDADLRDANLRDADLSAADLRDANLRDADLRDADLSAANLRAANLSDANLRDADLSAANLRAANLSDANLSAADLRAADLRDANLRDADLRAIKEDVFEVLSHAPAEVPALLAAVREGRINGSAYAGSCACLVGTLAKARGCTEYDIPGIVPNVNRPAERWFLRFDPGMKPENDQAMAITEEWITEWMAANPSAAAPVVAPSAVTA